MTEQRTKVFDVHGDGFSMTVTVFAQGGEIIPTLKDGVSGFDADAEQVIDAQIDAIEALVLAHACAGIDVRARHYVDGLNAAVTALTQ